MSATAEDLIRDFAERGVRLSRNGDRLRVKGRITEAERQTLADAKPMLLAALDDDATRAELARLALADGDAAELVKRLSPADLAHLAGLSTDALRSYLRVARDADLRVRGIVPPDETEVAECIRCGPVFIAAEVSAVLPIIGGRPTCAGCPWCHNRKSGLSIPRPATH